MTGPDAPRRAATRAAPLALVAALTLGPALGACAPRAVETPSPALPLAERVDRILAEPPLDGIHWGILLVDAESGRTLYERNANLRFVPASNMKIPVSHAAMALLGPDYRYRTALLAPDAPGPDGVVGGDLVLAASGDPTLGPPYHDSAEEALSELAGRLQAAGVRRVRGALVVDATAWDSTSVPSTWMVGNLSGRSGATGGVFAAGAGELRVRVTGTTPGAPAAVTWSPLGTADFVESRVTTVAEGEDGGLRSSYLPESRRWVVEGAVAAGETRSLVRSQRDPVRQASAAFLRAVEARGIVVEGGLRIEWDRDSSPLLACDCAMAELAVLESPPMSEIVRAILEPSQNWMTEQVVRTLGAEMGSRGSWSQGFRVMEGLLTGELEIDEADVHFRDGSGLAAYNLLSPRAVVRILDDGRRRPWAEEFRLAMAEPGKSGTTLSGRLRDLEGRVFAKTGTISHVNALSGYLVADDGRELLFSILTNASNLPAGQVRGGIDSVVRELARP